MKTRQKAITILVLVSFLYSNILWANEYLSPGAGLGDEGFRKLSEDALGLIFRHRDFQGFIRKDVPGYAKTNPVRNRLQQATLHKTNVVIDLAQGDFSFSQGFRGVLQTNFQGVNLERVKACIDSVFKYRLTLLPSDSKVLKSNISILFLSESNSIFGDYRKNGLAWVNLPAIQYLISRIEDPNLKTELLGLILGIGLSHEILGHELGFGDEEVLTGQDVDIALTFLKGNVEPFIDYLETTLQKRSLFLKRLRSTDLIAEIGLSKVVDYMEKGSRRDLNTVLIPFETTTGGKGEIKKLGISIGQKYPPGTSVRIVPKMNKNYGWYIEAYVWDEEGETWGSSPVKIFIFEEDTARLRLKSLDSRFSIEQREWIDYITEENMAIESGIVKPSPYFVRADRYGRIRILDPKIAFTVESLARREVRIELSQHPVCGELIYIYDKNKYEWELREIQKGIRKGLSMPGACYRKIGKNKYERFPQNISLGQQLWIDWYNSEPGQEGFEPPEYVTTADNKGQIWILTGKISFSADMLKGRQALVKFVREHRYRQFNPNGELIVIYDKEKYDRESFEIQMGMREEHSLPERAYIKTDKGQWRAVAEKISFHQLIWLDWMYARDEGSVLRPLQPMLIHVPESGQITLAHLGDREIKFAAKSLAGRDAVVKLVRDQNFGDVIYIYDAVEYFKEEREIKAGVRETFSLPLIAYKKTAEGVYEKIPKKEEVIRVLVDFDAYVWIQWAYQELGQETVRPAEEYVTDCTDGGDIYIGNYKGNILEFYSSTLRGRRVVIKLTEHQYYGELIYIYDAEKYYKEKIELASGMRTELSPPDGCYTKEGKGRCVSFPRGLSINQKSWLDWWYGESVKPIGDLEARMGDKNALRIARYGKRKVEFNVSGLVEGEEVIVRLVDDPDYGELVYIYQKGTILGNPNAAPIQVYRKISPGIGEPLTGGDWAKLQKLTWLDYLYRRPNIHGEEVKPRGYSITGRIGKNGRFAFYGRDMKFEFYLKQYADNYIGIIKTENPKFGYVFKVFIEEKTPGPPVAIYVRHPAEPRLIRIQDHPDYQQGDEDLRATPEEKPFAIPSKEEFIDRLITLSKWIDYWGLRERFKTLFNRLGVSIGFFEIKMEERYHLLADIGFVFINSMRDGAALEDALEEVIKEYKDRIAGYYVWEDIFKSKTGQDLLNNEAVRFLHISRFGHQIKERMFHSMGVYLGQNSYLEKSESICPTGDIADILEYIRLNRPNVVLVDIDDYPHRGIKLDIIRKIYNYLPVHACVIVIQRTSETAYMKTVEQIMGEQGFEVDTIEHTDIHCIVSGFKEREHITEDEIISKIGDKIRDGLKDKGIQQRHEIVSEIESILQSVGLSINGLYRLAKGLVSTDDPVLIARLLEYLDYNKEQYTVDRARCPHMPRVIGPGEVEFIFYAVPESEVLVSGDFTNWAQSPILLVPKGPVGLNGLQRYSTRVKGLYGVHYFKYIVNGQWYENLDSVSPYKETSTHHGHIVNNSVVWSPRPAHDPFINALVSNLVTRLRDESVSEDLKRRIALMLPLSCLPSNSLKRPDIAKILIEYLLTNIEGLATGALGERLELILKYFTLTDDDLYNIGKELAGEAIDIGLLYFLLDYIRYNTTPYEIPRDRFYQAPIVHEAGKIEFICYAEEGSQMILVGDFTSWEDRPVTLIPNQQERRGGLVRYAVTLNDLYGPHLFKFKIKRPHEHEFHWYDDLDSITPYIKIGIYGAKNCIVWSPRNKNDPFIRGLALGFVERIRSQDTQDFYKMLIIENFPLVNYPEFSTEALTVRERVNTRLWIAGRHARAPPIDTLQTKPVLYVSLRNFASPVQGLNGINGFIEWYTRNFGARIFSAVILVPPFEIGEANMIGEWGSPWATRSFDRIDPRIGSKEELIAGIKRLRDEFGLKILFDIGLHSTSCDSDILAEHPDWQVPREGAWKTDWVDITPLDLRKVETRNYLLGQLIGIKETYGIDGFRIDGVSQTSVFLMSAYEYWTSGLRTRYPDILLVAEGRDPFLFKTAQVIYGWDAAFSLKKCFEKNATPDHFYSTVLGKQSYGNYEKRGLLLSFSRTQDSSFEMGRPNTVKALLFAVPGSIPAVWMSQVCTGDIVGEREFKGDRHIKFGGFLVSGAKEDIGFVKRLIDVRAENPAFMFGNLRMVEPVHCSSPKEIIIFQRYFGPNSVCVIGGITNAHYKVELRLPFTDIDTSIDPEQQEYWVGNLITGKGIKIGKKELKDLIEGRRLLRVIISGDNPAYISVDKWDSKRYSLCEKGDPSRVILLGRSSDSSSVASHIPVTEPPPKAADVNPSVIPQEGPAGHRDEKVSGFKSSADCFCNYFGNDKSKTDFLLGKLMPKVRSATDRGEIKIIDASTLVYFDSEKKRVYPRSLDFKRGISKLKEKLQGLKIVIVNVDERYTSSEIIRALDISEAGDFVSVLDMKGSRNFRVDILEFVNRHLGSEHKGSNLTIAYYHENRPIFRRIADAKFIEVPDADNKTTFISGLGVLLAVLMEDKEFLAGLPYEIQQELRKVLIGGKDGAELFTVSAQPMTEEYCRMLTEEHQRIDQSV